MLVDLLLPSFDEIWNKDKHVRNLNLKSKKKRTARVYEFNFDNVQ